MSFQDMDVFNGHLVLTMTKEGLPMLCSINLPIHPYCKVCNINSLCCTSPEINLFLYLQHDEHPHALPRAVNHIKYIF